MFRDSEVLTVAQGRGPEQTEPVEDLPLFAPTPAERFSQLRFPGSACSADEAHAYLATLFEHHPVMQESATLWIWHQSVLTNGTERYEECGVETALSIICARPGTHHLHILDENWRVILGSNGDYRQPIVQRTTYHLIQDGTIINQNKEQSEDRRYSLCLTHPRLAWDDERREH
jgi:hypothetical protein